MLARRAAGSPFGGLRAEVNGCVRVEQRRNPLDLGAGTGQALERYPGGPEATGSLRSADGRRPTVRVTREGRIAESDEPVRRPTGRAPAEFGLDSDRRRITDGRALTQELVIAQGRRQH